MKCLRGFTWQHFKPQPTELFCHTIFFAKFNMLISFSLTSLKILRKHITPHDFPVEQGHIVPHKAWRDFFLKDFRGRWGIIYWGDVLHGGLMIRSCQGWGSFKNTFFSNHFLFFQLGRDMNFNIMPWPKLWKYLYLKLIVRRFQRLCHVQADLDIFVKLAVKIADCIRKIPFSHYVSGVGDFMQNLPSFVISWMVTCALISWLHSFFRFA